TVYVCTNCGSEYVQWRGRCGTCLEWNTVQEFKARRKPAASPGDNVMIPLAYAYSKGSREQRTRVPDDSEMNAVLGGGIMPGSIILVGGDPGVGKSTLLLQMAGKTSGGGPVLYISGEENANQIASRALRLGIHDPELLLWCETDADIIADTVQKKAPSLVVIDSIQTMLCDAAGSSSVGGITQVRECVGLFLRLAKSTGVPIILVGHVTKSGDVAGPRTVEHMVDCVLYLEGGGVSSLRVLRAAKNRFGSSEEVGVYEMNGGRDGRLVPVSDPSSFFLATRQDSADSEGCAISVVLEGMRSMTVEVQSLVSWTAGTGGYGGRKIVDGISSSRLLLILAVLQKRYGISFNRQDVYVNVVGGMNLGKGSKSGGGSDLAVAVAVVSSLLGIPVRSDTAFVGEVGLLGELRPVHALEKRISEARRMGFSRIVTP
ncbi:Rad51/RecA-like protein, partial [Thalassiosira pseudonana CCMP1335]